LSRGNSGSEEVTSQAHADITDLKKKGKTETVTGDRRRGEKTKRGTISPSKKKKGLTGPERFSYLFRKTMGKDGVPSQSLVDLGTRKGEYERDQNWSRKPMLKGKGGLSKTVDKKLRKKAKK